MTNEGQVDKAQSPSGVISDKIGVLSCNARHKRYLQRKSPPAGLSEDLNIHVLVLNYQKPDAQMDF